MLTAILFVLKIGMAWDDLPAELGYGTGRSSPTMCSFGIKWMSGTNSMPCSPSSMVSTGSPGRVPHRHLLLPSPRKG